jgi:RNase P subunit RPR2
MEAKQAKCKTCDDLGVINVVCKWTPDSEPTGKVLVACPDCRHGRSIGGYDDGC